MFKIKETPYYKKYYLFGKCVWKRDKSAKQVSKYLLSVIDDKKSQMESYINEHSSVLKSQLQSLSKDCNKNYNDLKSYTDANLDENDKNLKSCIDKNYNDLKTYTDEILDEHDRNLKFCIDKNYNDLKTYTDENIKNIYTKSKYAKVLDNKLLIDGLYNIECWGAWIKDSANIYLLFDKNSTQDVELQIDIAKAFVEKNTSQELIIFINHEYYTTFATNNNFDKVFIKIPHQKLIEYNFRIIISFLCTNQISPFELGVSGDQRKLSYGLIGISSNSDVIISSFDSKNLYHINKYKTSFMQEDWDKYLNLNLDNIKIQKLCNNLSPESIDTVLKLLYRRQHEYEFSLQELYQKHLVYTNDISRYKIKNKTGFQPEVFYFKNGLKFLKDKIIKKHLSNGCVIDGGACSGDSTLMFSEYDFVKKVYAFEPVKNVYDDMTETLDINKCNKAEAVNIGLSDKDGFANIMGKKCKTITIDNFAKDKKISCIKLDIEGMEYSVINGAIDTIKRDNPLLLICIYHTPKDFFEIKPLIESLNLGYKFKIIDTEPCNSSIGVHAVLIAYME